METNTDFEYFKNTLKESESIVDFLDIIVLVEQILLFEEETSRKECDTLIKTCKKEEKFINSIYSEMYRDKCILFRQIDLIENDIPEYIDLNKSCEQYKSKLLKLIDDYKSYQEKWNRLFQKIQFKISLKDYNEI